VPKKFRDADRELRKAGFTPDRQSGSHITYKNKQTNRQVTVPKHDEIKTGTWASIERDAGLKQQKTAGDSTREARRLANEGVVPPGRASGEQPQKPPPAHRHGSGRKRGSGRGQ
jgi:predicted RNA binding protein YcfA (HicA-like mRNA interferase family)